MYSKSLDEMHENPSQVPTESDENSDAYIIVIVIESIIIIIMIGLFVALILFIIYKRNHGRGSYGK